MSVEEKQIERHTRQEATEFASLGLSPEVLRSLSESGYATMFPIQREAIPPIMDGKDVIGQAHTGSGKTAAYALPIIQKITEKPYVQALVVVPTRELALQVTDEFNKLAKYLNIRAYSIYGGQSITPQIERLRKKTPQIVVATPGRLIDHIERETIEFQDVKFVVLDEADRMLDMGFIDDVDYIMKQLPSGTRTALFSATMPNEIVKLSDKYMNDPVEVLIDSDELSVDEIDQSYAVVGERDKLSVLMQYIKKNSINSGIVFCSTKFKTQRLAERLQSLGLKAAPIHGDLSQNQREHTMNNFRRGHVELLIATDVAARGIDVPAVSHVINYDVPQDPLTYFHRIGRTARAGKSGKAITLVSESEYPDFTRIEGMTEVRIRKVTDIVLQERIQMPQRHSEYQRRYPARRDQSDNRGRRGSRFNRGYRSDNRRPEPSGKQGSSGFGFTERV